MVFLLNTTQKKVIREVLRYFIDTTGLSSDHFILLVQRNAMRLREDSKYEEWLAVKSYNFLKEMGISLADCLDYRFLMTQRNPDSLDDIAEFANNAQHDSSFPKQEEDYEKLSEYLELSELSELLESSEYSDGARAKFRIVRKFRKRVR